MSYSRKALALPRITDVSVRRRFAQKLLIVGPGSIKGCWLWQGCINPRNGYGCFAYNGRRIGAHRISYAIHVGPIPEGMTVHHKFKPEGYDHPLLHDVNPANLELRSNSDNIAERNGRNGYQGSVKEIVLKRIDAQSIDTYECDRCRGTMVKGPKRFVCLNCDRVLTIKEAKDLIPITN